MPPREVARIGAQVAAALAAAHSRGVVHRDIKPANILVGQNDTVKLTDFGVSRVVEDVTGTSTGTFVGTPAYLAPEVARGHDVTFAADAYSLGATLYTAVEGRPPAGRSANPMLLLHRIASGEFTPPKKAGPLTGLLTSLLSVDPEQRPNVAEVSARLFEIAEGRDDAPVAEPEPVAPVVATVPVPAAVAQTVPAPADAAPAGKKRWRPILALVALCVLVAVTTTLITINATDNDDPPADENAAGQAPGVPATSSDPATTEPADDDESSTSDTPSSGPATTTSTRAPATSAAPPATPADPAAAITSYYALMPGSLKQAWTRLTPKFQTSPAGGWGGYTGYWGTVQSVRASAATGQGNTAEVTLDYVYKDGRKMRERHRYGLVNQNGTWLIDTVTHL